jgi:hypothetical protein
MINTHFNDTVIKSGPNSFSARHTTNKLNQSVPWGMPSQAFFNNVSIEKRTAHPF